MRKLLRLTSQIKFTNNQSLSHYVPLARKESTTLLHVLMVAEYLAKLIFDQVKAAGFDVRRVTLWETASASASYSRD